MELYRKKLRDVKDAVEPPLARLDEATARPGAINDTRTFVEQAKSIVARWNFTHPQVSRFAREARRRQQQH